MSASLANPTSLLGYHVIGGDEPDTTRPVGFAPAEWGQWRDGPIPLATVAGYQLRPQLAVVLATGVTPGMTPGALFLAIAGRCLVVTVVDTAGATVAVVADEQLLEPTASGPAVLLGPTGVASCEPATDTDVVGQLHWLVTSTELSAAGLSAGQMVFPIPRRAARPLPAAAGTWQANGPAGASIPVAMTAPAGPTQEG
jgi:hypothetical protein